jgi:hypothetical protein
MGNLATFLQREFLQNCPSGWECKVEQPVLSKELAQMLGFAPRADVLLTRRDGSRRLWIEFEVSRADPVANHAKFMAANLFEPKSEIDVFIAMMSSHIDRGRHNLAASVIQVMRQLGMQAFQTVLFPGISGEGIKELNHKPLVELIHNVALPTQHEIDRAVGISETVLNCCGHSIHFVGNYFEVMLNIHHWNAQMATEAGSRLWAKRTVVYFAFDPVTMNFAPSKYCAFVPANRNFSAGRSRIDTAMTMEIYVALDESETRFDGNIAKNHLVDRLSMKATPVADSDESIRQAFRNWLDKFPHAIRVHPRGAIVISVLPWWGK